MWLWYLELYLFTLAAFGLGAGLGMLVVRLVVRHRADDPLLLLADAPVGPGSTPTTEQPGTTS